MRLYQTTIKTRQYVTAAELSYESGYKSYSTFSVAFKQINGQTVKSWMKQQE
jgi:AraC-like DNA-binding protein